MNATTFTDARKALDFLERHRLEPTVANYEIALMFHTRPNSSLARAVAETADTGLRLTAEEADRLARQYLSRPGDANPTDRERVIALQAEELGTLTSDAHDLTSSLGRDVGTIMAGSGDWPQETGAFVARLSSTERDLADLRAEFAKLQSQIAAGQAPDRDDAGDRDEMTHALSRQGARSMISHLGDDDQRYVLIVFSIDDLVGLNQRFGRAVGDNILNAFASTLRSAFPDHDLIRWTGNEFVITMVNAPLGAARVAVQEAIMAMATRRLKLRGSGDDIGMVTASAGIDMGQGAAGEDVLERARARLMVAAAAGGNRYEDRSPA